MYVSDHQNSRLGIYGMVIPINADRLTVTLLDVSNESLALIKIVGKVQSLLHHCKIDFLKLSPTFSKTSRNKKADQILIQMKI